MSNGAGAPGQESASTHPAGGRSAHGTVEVFVADEQDEVAVDTDRWLRLAVQVLAEEGVDGDVEMTLAFIDETAMAAYNERFMGKQGPTDVLSFPMDEEALPGAGGPSGSHSGHGDDDEPDDDVPRVLGDVLVCPSVAARNAPERVGPHHDGSLDDELALLVVHGLLHLLGMDHIDDEEAEVMEARERALLHRFHRPILVPSDRIEGNRA